MKAQAIRDTSQSVYVIFMKTLQVNAMNSIVKVLREKADTNQYEKL